MTDQPPFELTDELRREAPTSTQIWEEISGRGVPVDDAFSLVLGAMFVLERRLTKVEDRVYDDKG